MSNHNRSRVVLQTLVVVLGLLLSQAVGVVPAQAAPEAFGKVAPANNATGQPLSVTLSWGSATGATSYDYCYDTTGDNACSSWVSTGTSLSAVVGGLSPNTSYYWHVRAVNGGTTYSDGGETAFWRFTTGSLPNIFAKVAPANDATGQPLNVTLSWGSSSGATSYEYCIDTNNDGNCNTSWVSTGASTSVVPPGLGGSTAYYWHVRAVNSLGTTYSDGGPTAFWKFTTGSPPGAFGKAAPASGATNQPVNVTLSWGASSGATSYDYCIDTTNDDACSSWTSTGASTSVVPPGLAASTTYYWQVRAVNSLGTTYSDGGATAFWNFATGSSLAPGAFGKMAPVNFATNQPLSVTLSWNASSGATSYQYCYDTTGDNACSSWVSTGTSTSVVVAGLSANTTYYWHVRAVNSVGTTYSDGSTTAFWRFTTASLPGAFGKTSPTNNATNQPINLTLSWGSSSGATSYEYCIDTNNDSNCNTSWISTGVSTSVVPAGLGANTIYYWHVRAVNSLGTTYSDGGATAFWRFTTGSSLAPGAFGKVAPANYATGQPLSVTLYWGTSVMTPAGSYQYCYDTTNDNACSSWASTTSTSATITGLSGNITYYWHVRAVNSSGTTYSDGGSTAFWRFTTASLPGAFGKVAPVNNATGQPVNVTLSWSTSVMTPAGNYEYCYDTTNDYLCSYWASTSSTSVGIAGLSANTTYYWHVRAVNSSGATYSDGSATAFWRFTTGSGAPGSMLFRSWGANDGWVRESAETSGVGGAVDSTAATCRVGDDEADRQYRTVLDFNTARLPDNAIITRVVLKFKPASVAGTNPFLTHGSLTVDIRTGAFGDSVALGAGDFQASSSRPGAGFVRSTPLPGGQYRAVIGAAGYANVNLRGHTQFRLRFAVEDNDDRGADYLAFLCGNSPLLRDRPVLVVTYRLP